MNRIILFCIFVISQAASAAEIQPFPKSPTKKAVELVQEYLAAPAHRRTALWNELKELDPSGPVFVDEALKLMAAKSEKWKSYSEPRSSMLALVEDAIRTSSPWKDFEQSDLKRSIHQSAQMLLQLLAYKSGHQEDLLAIFNRLELWDQTDLTFLIQKSYSGVVGNRYFPKLVGVYSKEASIEDKQYLLHRTRKQSHRQLEQYALAYQTDLMDQQDYVWLLRLFMSRGEGFRGRSYGLHETESYKKDRDVIERLINGVLRDLHLRLRAEDPLIKAAFDELRESRGWPGLRLTEAHKAAHMEFLRGLYTGRLIEGCAKDLSSIERED